MIAVTPALAAASTPSAKGKAASDASTEPRARVPALSTANCTLETRLVWPAPLPTSVNLRASTIAFDFARGYHGVAGVGLSVRLNQHLAAGQSTGIGMLDNRYRWCGK